MLKQLLPLGPRALSRPNCAARLVIKTMLNVVMLHIVLCDIESLGSLVVVTRKAVPVAAVNFVVIVLNVVGFGC